VLNALIETASVVVLHGEPERVMTPSHSGIIVLDALLKLRQTCCDPRLVKLDSARGVRESAKLELLMEMLPALLSEGRRVLLFSQFTEMLALIARELNRRHLQYVTLTGDTRDRAEPVRKFQEGEVPLFLLSLKAGGVGLNLTAADTVIHYDPWWNPAAETQASDRAHRIGQDKPVFVYRLICADTVEERIEDLKARKAELAQAVLEGGGTRDKLAFDEADLDALFAAE
jgi:SNF2 family DNA or RNA helicase